MSKVSLKSLNISQWEQLKEQYCELIVDGMDYKTLEVYAKEQMGNYMDSLSYKEIKEEIDNHDSELFDELVNNVISNPIPVYNNQGGKC